MDHSLDGLKVQRLVLKDGVTRPDVIRHAAALRWPAVGSHDAQPGRLFQYVRRGEGGQVTIFYLEDDDFGYACLDLQSVDAAALSREADAVRADAGGVPVFTDAEVRACFEEVRACFDEARAVPDRVRAISLVSLAGPRAFDPAWMGYHEQALADPSPDARYAALWAMSEAAWPEFRPLAARLAEEDPDAETRVMAGRLAAGLDRHQGVRASAVTA